MAKRRYRAIFIILLFLMIACLLSNCTRNEHLAEVTPVVTTTPKPGPDQFSLQTITPTKSQDSIWIDSHIPMTFLDQFSNLEDFHQTTERESAAAIISTSPDDTLIGSWYYLLVAPFPTTTDSISYSDFQNFWQDKSSTELPFTKLLVSEQTSKTITVLLGPTANNQIQIINQTDIMESAWSDKENTWAIIPFESLQPEWKIIALDQQKPTDSDFDSKTYPLKLSITANNPSLLKSKPISNFNPEKLTSINITGVTALVRATAKMMETNGIPYPAEQIKEFLLETDYTHMVNEVSFSPDCPPPQYVMDTLQFCSNPDYFALLQQLDIDIIEFTGDHLEDWGIDAIYYTLDLYKQESIHVYGGGNTLAEAKQPLLLNHNGNNIAFIGCNAKSPAYAHAAADYPGTWFCDFQDVEAIIQDLKAQNYTVIVTVQHKEIDQSTPPQEMITDFEFLHKAGADVIIGSQAHQPQTMTISDGVFIHYGLGNLFFDQYNESEQNRHSFIDRLFFYDNHLINVELLSNQFIDWAQSRPMTDEERHEFLANIFAKSVWTTE